MDVWGFRRRIIVLGALAAMAAGATVVSAPAGVSPVSFFGNEVCTEIIDWDGSALGQDCVELDPTAFSPGPNMGIGHGHDGSTTTTSVPSGTTTTTTTPPASDEVLFIGDSLCIGSESQLATAAASAGVTDYSTDCLSGRGPTCCNGTSAIDVVNALKSSGDPLPPKVVLEVGTNGFQPTSMVDLLNAIDWSPSIAWVTFAVYAPQSQSYIDQTASDLAALRTRAASQSNLSLCDWVVDELDPNLGTYLGSDGIHYTAAGHNAFGTFLAQCAASLSSPVTTTTTTTTTTTSGPTTTTPGFVATPAIGPIANVVTPNFVLADKLTDCTSPNCLSPGDSSSEPTGNFRIFCEISHLNNDDAIVFPGQTGVAHQHMYFGNPSADGQSNYQNLRENQVNGTCSGGNANNTAYWAPTVIDPDGSGSNNVGNNAVVIPRGMVVYYKGEPGGVGNGETLQDQQTKIQNTQPFPNGLRMIAGQGFSFNPVKWKCSTASSFSDLYPSLDELYNSSMVQNNGGTCPSDPNIYGDNFGYIVVSLNFPPCWDGVNLDSTNHQDHMSYANNVGTCPSSHPVRVPSLSQTFHFQLQSGEDFGNWFLSSDAGNTPGVDGASWHNDVYLGWDNATQEQWVEECIRGMRNSNSHLCEDANSVSEDISSVFHEQQLISGSPGLTPTSRIN